MDLQIFMAFGTALLLGLLVGLQREWGKRRLAGIRTFALFTLFGAGSALLARDYGGLVVAAGLLAVGAMLVAGHLVANRDDEERPKAGHTTEIAALVMFAVGALLMAGYTLPAVVLGGVTAVLLQLKQPLRTAIGKLSATDVRAIFQFVLIALVILPLLPNEALGPYGVMNPFRIWLMVVLIVAISLSGYLAYRTIGVRGGTILGGLLGGLISSTATTVSYARQCATQPGAIGTASLVIVIASVVMLVRVALEITVVAREMLSSLLPPLAIMFVFMAGIGVLFYYRLQQAPAEPTEHSNPSQLQSAVLFGLVYAVVLLIVAFAGEKFGDQAIYIVSAISGLTDVDALTLSVAELYNQQRVEDSTAWRAILLAVLSNLGFKMVVAGILGGRRLFAVVGAAFGSSILLGALLVLLWP